MPLDKLAEQLVELNKGVLFLDVCTLLDVIRAAFRNKIPYVESAIRLDAEISAGALNCSLVLPSLFHQEWNDNVGNVMKELTGSLHRHRLHSGDLAALYQYLYQSPLLIPDVTSYGFEHSLEELCNRIIASADIVAQSSEFESLAIRRVIARRAPASPGKQEAKDCMNFEEFLGLGTELRKRGLTKKIVFASSNTNDYCEASRPRPEIEDDLNAISADFAVSLPHGYSLASR